MGNSAQLQIPVPCHEDWNGMTVVEKGRFCNACKKTVVDFTGMSNTQLMAYFRKPTVGSVCGRFNPDQLDSDISEPVKRLPWVRYFFSILIPAFLLSAKVKAQGKVRSITGDTIYLESPIKKLDANGNPIAKTISPVVKKLEGRITDSYGKPVIGAAVMFKETVYETISDHEGRYSITAPAGLDKMILIFTCVGFQSRQIETASIKNKKQVDVSMVILEKQISGEVIIVRKKSGRKRKINN